MRRTANNTSPFEESLRAARPLYWVLTVALGFVYYWAVRSLPDLLQPTRLVLFTLLMLLHTALHWVGPFMATRRYWLIPYFLLQAVLIFTIVTFAPRNAFIYGLYWAMSGEAAMVLTDLRQASLTIVAYMALSAVNFGLGLGWGRVPELIAYIAPMAFFILVYALMFQRQAKARQQTQSLLAELETAHRQLAEYAVEVEALTLSHERERMARELHDTLAQGLAGVILQLEAVDSHLSRGHVERAQSIAVQAMARARSTLADARRAIDDLRRADTEMDLEAAIRSEAERFSAATGIACDLDLEIISKIPEPVSEQALRIVSEGLTNIARHAHAGKVNLQVEAHNGTLDLRITDDGCGFDSDSPIQSGHYGLIGMRERARLSGGMVNVHSKPGQGTTLEASLPLAERTAVQ